VSHRFDTVVIGGGQAGLAMGYYLKQQGREFVILNAGTRIGDAWRSRWDSLKLFTPAAFNALPGLPFPAPPASYPTKDAMADYLERYAATFGLPVCLGRHVNCLSREGDRYRLQVGEDRYEADRVVVASGPYHTPYIPAFAAQLDPSTHQLHSRDYRNPAQLTGGDVVVVGAGNSGGEIAMDLAATRRVYLSGRDTGSVPAYPEGALGLWLTRPLWALLGLIHADTPIIGRRVRAFDRSRGTPLVRLKPADLARAGVVRVPRTEGVSEGKPVLADGSVLEVGTVVWATGYKPDFGWVKLPVFEQDGYPKHHRGVVEEAPSLYFLGLPFQHTFLSAVVGGVGDDARYVAEQLAQRARTRR
jgi:putative flavoprotein involved in K+ transport